MTNMKNTESFFDFAAYVGLTKHLGGQEATQKVIDSCQIKKTATSSMSAAAWGPQPATWLKLSAAG